MRFALNDYFSSSKYMTGIISRNMGFLTVCLMASLVLGTEGLLIGDWTPGWDACIISNNNLIKDDVDSLDECKEYCEATEEPLDFICNSVEYNANGRRCILSDANSNSQSYTEPCYVEGTSWTYAEFLFNSDWTTETNSCIIGHNDIVFDGVGFNICKAYCEELLGFYCGSVEYLLSANLCSLSTSNSNSDDYMYQCPGSGWIFTEIAGDTPPPAAADAMAPAAADENEDQLQ